MALRLRAYMIAVEGVSLAALLVAERRVVRGEAGLDLRYAPQPPQLGVLCRAIEAEMRAAAMPRTKPAELERFDAPPDPEMIERIDRLRTQLETVANEARAESRQQWLERMGARVLR